MKLIELHILQSFPVSCLNRDDVGAPKTAVFGGVRKFGKKKMLDARDWNAIQAWAEDVARKLSKPPAR